LGAKFQIFTTFLRGKFLSEFSPDFSAE
jgi:hypothetical protein